MSKTSVTDGALLSAAAPTMYLKLKDTVAWLDRHLETMYGCPPDNFIANEAAMLEELRDDLAKTLRRVEEG